MGEDYQKKYIQKWSKNFSIYVNEGFSKAKFRNRYEKIMIIDEIFRYIDNNKDILKLKKFYEFYVLLSFKLFEWEKEGYKKCKYFYEKIFRENIYKVNNVNKLTYKNLLLLSEKYLHL